MFQIYFLSIYFCILHVFISLYKVYVNQYKCLCKKNSTEIYYLKRKFNMLMKDVHPIPQVSVPPETGCIILFSRISHFKVFMSVVFSKKWI